MTNPRFFGLAGIAVLLCYAVGFALGNRGGDEVVADDLVVTGTANRADPKLSAVPGGHHGAARNFSSVTRSRELSTFAKFSAYLHLIYRAEAHEMVELMETLRREVPDDIGGDSLMGSLAMRWATIDPHGAFAALLEGRPIGIEKGRKQIVAAMVKNDPRAAWAQVLNPDGPAKGGRMGQVEWRDQLVRKVLVKITEENGPELAIELVTSLENPAQVHDALNPALAMIANSNPREFLDAVERLPISPYEKRSQLIGAAIEQLARSDSAAALAFLEGFDGRERTQAELGIARGMAKGDPEVALQWASGLGGSTGLRAQVEILRRQAESDPVAAAENVLAMSSPESRSVIAKEVAKEWYQRDEEAALGWVREELEGAARQYAYGELLREAIRHAEFDKDFDKDFDKLLEMADGSPQSGKGAQLRFANQWGLRDPLAAAEWAVTRGEGAANLFGHIASNWARSDPDALGQFASTLTDQTLRGVAENKLDAVRGTPTEEGEGEQ